MHVQVCFVMLCSNFHRVEPACSKESIGINKSDLNFLSCCLNVCCKLRCFLMFLLQIKYKGLIYSVHKLLISSVVADKILDRSFSRAV